MEKCVDSDYIQSEHEGPQSSDTKNCSNCGFSISTEEKTKCKNCWKFSRVRKKIASKKRSSGRSEIENVTSKKSEAKFSKKRLNVLKKLATETERKSVQKKTKIIQRNVPDRLGKYVSSSCRSETKLLVGDSKLETKFLRKECSVEGNLKPSEDHSQVDKMSDECTETKLSLLGKECLSKEEAVRLRNSFESDMVKKNIFENFFDDCLDSTSKGNEVSSQEKSNIGESGERLKSDCDDKVKDLPEKSQIIEKKEKGNDSEVTPEKKKPETTPPQAPVKIRDHSNYYSSHKNTRHVCTYCHKIFKSNGKLNSHVYSHTGERPFDCNHCGKAFSSKFKLVRHLLIHSEIRKFVCQICDRTFLRNDHLKNHYKIHDPQKKMYKCTKENCDKEYSSLMSHKKHMAYHNVEDGDLKCLICNVKFETKEEILFHLKSHSGSRLFKSQSDKKFKCEFCDRLFLTRKDVTRHLVVHTGERDFLCQFCPQRFGRKDHLVRHIKKSHGNEDLTLKNEDNKTGKEEIRKSEEYKPKTPEKSFKKSSKEETIVGVEPSGSSEVEPSVLSADSLTNENNTQTDEHNNKTHIVITVQGKSVKNTLENRKRKLCDNGNKKKSFQRNESLVPIKKQVPLAKGKNSTTQILLQNIPNILIIPNNSIILLRNQSGTNKNPKAEDVADGSRPPETSFRVAETEPPEISDDLMSSPQGGQNALIHDGNEDFSSNFGYDTTMFQPPSHFLEGFCDNDNFCNFQSDFGSFGSQFEESEQLNFEMLNHGDLLPRPEVCLTTGQTPIQGLRDGDLLTEASRQIKLLETEMGGGKPDSHKPEDDIGKGLFEDGNESLMLNESILNDFKDESSSILPPDNDIGIINNLLNQTNDNCGFEILRNLLTTENPGLPPLPGFSQIFHNSNTNSS